MPCMGPDPREMAGWERRNLEDEIHKLTNMLCALCRNNENDGRSMPRRVTTWWKKHKVIDEQRKRAADEKKKKKELKASGLSKLTDPEKRALGLAKK